MDASQVKERLAGHAVFGDLSDAELTAIATAGEVAEVAADTAFIEEGTVGDTLFIILEGKAEIFKSGPRKDHYLASAGADDILGEVGLLLPCPRSASVRATTDLQVFRLGRGAFEAMLDADDRDTRRAGRKLLGHIASTLGERQREANRKLVQLIEEAEGPTRVDLSSLKSRFQKSLSYHV